MGTWDEGTTKDRAASSDWEGGQRAEGGENEGRGEGWPNMVDVVAMPTIIVIATTHSSEMT